MRAALSVTRAPKRNNVRCVTFSEPPLDTPDPCLKTWRAQSNRKLGHGFFYRSPVLHGDPAVFLRFLASHLRLPQNIVLAGQKR